MPRPRGQGRGPEGGADQGPMPAARPSRRNPRMIRVLLSRTSVQCSYPRRSSTTPLYIQATYTPQQAGVPRGWVRVSVEPIENMGDDEKTSVNASYMYSVVQMLKKRI